MPLTGKQVRYLWAVGYFRRGNTQTKSKVTLSTKARIEKKSPQQSRLSQKTYLEKLLSSPKLTEQEAAAHIKASQNPGQRREAFQKELGKQRQKQIELSRHQPQITRTPEFQARLDELNTKIAKSKIQNQLKVLDLEISGKTELKFEYDDAKSAWEDASKEYASSPLFGRDLEGVRDYVGAIDAGPDGPIGSNRINGFLRGTFEGERDYDAVERAVESLENAMIPSKKERVVYRGIQAFEGLKLEEGSILQDDAFVSTTTNPQSAIGFFQDPREARLFRITVPPRTPSRLVPPTISEDFESENEIILNRETRLRVKRSKHFIKVLDVPVEVFDLEVIL